MSIDRELLSSVAKKCESIFNLTESIDNIVPSVIKAIEQDKQCQIIIMPPEDDQRIEECEGFTATCEPELKLDQTVPFRQHFIFLKPEPNLELQRFRIGHELGHCAIHWPDTNLKGRQIWGELGNIGKFYLVKFTKKEEEEADAFACLLGASLPTYVTRFRVEINGAIEKVQEYMKQGFLQSLRFKK